MFYELQKIDFTRAVIGSETHFLLQGAHSLQPPLNLSVCSQAQETLDKLIHISSATKCLSNIDSSSRL